MTPTLPPGRYPFVDEEFELADMTMAEAPPAIEAALRRAAADNRIGIVRNVPVELVCRSEGEAFMRFLVWWPEGSERLHILTPKELIRGRA